ncbi:hypothetical protein [Pseudomonas sp.]|jgi:hypothetical protein|uniref:hypothetical protein n=1 Tax=Pseudomonas sp. TaxID=306 RepID=UPI00289F9CB2|nr:hypothetical protein [Pseudomonas sp.]
MLKIVPDPPHAPETCHTLEELLIQTAEYLVCALSIANQSTLFTFNTPAHPLNLATLHEIEAARGLVEMALGKLQIRH